MEVFSVTRGRSATSTFCTYCGGCSVPRHIYCIEFCCFFVANLSTDLRDKQVSRYVSHRGPSIAIRIASRH